MNIPEIGTIRTAKHKYGETTKGIHLSRFGASWLRVGGKSTDRKGFIVWMMNIPFIEDDGTITYINQDDAEDAYWMMSCGKSELQYYAADFIKTYGTDKRGYVILDEELKKKS